MGGPHATAKAGEVLDICPDVDYVVRGEGEYTLLELIRALEKGEATCHSITGLSYRKDNVPVHNPPRSMAVDLHRFPFPDRTLLMHEQHYTSEDMGLIMTTRGCPYACTYCATNTQQVSYRSRDHILEEIQAVKARYGTTQFTFKDDSFTVNRKNVRAFCNALIGAKVHITWECNTRVNLINEPLLRLMKRAGCNFIKVGIESGSERVLQRMNKQITHEQVRQAAQLFRKVGIHWTGYFMMGVPGETEEDIRQTIAFLHEVKPDFASIGVYEPFPGTVMFEEGIQRGLVKPQMTREDFYTMLPNQYYKKNPQQQTDTMTPECFARLEAEIKELIRQYNRHPVRVAKMAQARLRMYWHEPNVLWEDIKKFLSY
jgi:radical SAM superfamily enzyme YgiQ (UPF0313 family)